MPQVAQGLFYGWVVNHWELRAVIKMLTASQLGTGWEGAGWGPVAGSREGGAFSKCTSAQVQSLPLASRDRRCSLPHSLPQVQEVMCPPPTAPLPNSQVTSCPPLPSLAQGDTLKPRPQALAPVVPCVSNAIPHMAHFLTPCPELTFSGYPEDLI